MEEKEPFAPPTGSGKFGPSSPIRGRWKTDNMTDSTPTPEPSDAPTPNEATAPAEPQTPSDPDPAFDPQVESESEPKNEKTSAEPRARPQPPKDAIPYRLLAQTDLPSLSEELKRLAAWLTVTATTLESIERLLHQPAPDFLQGAMAKPPNLAEMLHRALESGDMGAGRPDLVEVLRQYLRR